jgi:3'-phosphoadenosine 5'-phosphosulfate (PAPS) 3'-phosphatase
MNNILEIDKINELEKTIRQAGQLLMNYWPGKGSTGTYNTKNLDIQAKKDGSFVTEADFKSNEILMSALKKLFPNDGILSEEIPADQDLHSYNRVWVVDPLDGTKSFIDGQDDFSILVGLVEKGKPVFGMLYFPARELFGCAQSQLSAVVENRALSVSEYKQAREQSIYLRHCDFNIGNLAYPNWMDSGLALLSVAQGAFDGIIIKLVQHKEWDLVAPSMFITEAGGKVTDGYGNPISYCNKSFDYEYFVASNGHIHDQLLALIRS